MLQEHNATTGFLNALGSLGPQPASEKYEYFCGRLGTEALSPQGLMVHRFIQQGTPQSQWEQERAKIEKLEKTLQAESKKIDAIVIPTGVFTSAKAWMSRINELHQLLPNAKIMVVTPQRMTSANPFLRGEMPEMLDLGNQVFRQNEGKIQPAEGIDRVVLTMDDGFSAEQLLDLLHIERAHTSPQAGKRR